MLYINGEFPFIIIYGGLSFYNNESIINQQYSLGDLWIYSINSNSLREVFPNSDESPSKRFSACMISINNNQLILYGGLNSDKVYDELWLYNYKINFWVQIIPNKSNSSNWPTPLKHASIIKFSKVNLIILGSNLIWRILLVISNLQRGIFRNIRKFRKISIL
jgi:hypothetical protein